MNNKGSSGLPLLIVLMVILIGSIVITKAVVTSDLPMWLKVWLLR